MLAPLRAGCSGHRLLIPAFMIASKITCDDTYSTDPVASSVGARLPSRRSTRWYVNCAPTLNGNLTSSPAHSGNSRPWFGAISSVQVPARLVTLFQLLPQERSPTRNRAIELLTPSAGRSSITPPRTLRQAPRSRHHPDLKLEDALLQLHTVFVYTSRIDLEVHGYVRYHRKNRSTLKSQASLTTDRRLVRVSEGKARSSSRSGDSVNSMAFVTRKHPKKTMQQKYETRRLFINKMN